ncbi:ABC transporter permease [Croceicoccus sp. F390]|uniref:Transport permease protein n=1 Tax=Croceicoccus esteveae TaxID=3075597 RepID=A0ABU2ZJS9_9SPHN|nr:ABC transporter permease [Croceicoccus sp. F390]MDT0576867.1 ABC transporter permease [Croceicoccus sp. F390]
MSSHTPQDTPPQVTVIRPHTGWRTIDVRELASHWDLLRFLTLRSVKIRYAQSALGMGWAVIQPVAQMVVFTVIFGSLVGVGSDGSAYPVFAFVALVPWTYFASAVTQSTNSLPKNAAMLSKIYLPRMILPISEVCARLVDFAIGFVLLIGMLFIYGVQPTAGVIVVPLLILIMVIAALGIGLWLTALAIQFRDINYATEFFVQLLMYAAPVVYPASLVPERFQLLYALNPMVGVIEGFRAAFLGSRAMPWDLIGVGAAVAVFLLVSGAFFFRRREPLFADVA